MKRLTLFPKTFLASISMLAAMIVIAHGLIYLLMPAVYLQQKQQTAETQIADLSRQLRGQSADDMRQTARSFALRHNVTITLTIDGRDETFQGFQAVNIIAEQPVDTSLVTIAGEQIDPASIIIRTTTARGSASIVSVKPVHGGGRHSRAQQLARHAAGECRFSGRGGAACFSLESAP